jgi:hypothetical protein
VPTGKGDSNFGNKCRAGTSNSGEEFAIFDGITNNSNELLHLTVATPDSGSQTAQYIIENTSESTYDMTSVGNISLDGDQAYFIYK